VYDSRRTVLDACACVLWVVHGGGNDRDSMTVCGEGISEGEHTRQKRALRPDAEGRYHGDTEC
jgi:hypothetical protein